MSRKSTGFRMLSREGKQRELQLTVESKENRKQEARRSRRAVLMLGVMIIAVCCIGAIAGWRSSSPSSASLKNSLAAMPMTSPPPLMPANAPSKEYVYAGSALLATSEPFRVAPEDVAVWRPTDGTWYILNSSNQQSGGVFGSSGDIPDPADFDGDGKTDFCVFRPSTHNWYIMRTSDNVFYTYDWGFGTDKPVAADYDGDGRADIAVYRPSDTTWYIVPSSTNSYYGVNLNLTGDNSADVPVPADYDGDGKADIAIWRPSTATFTVKKSTDGQTMSYSIGTAGDRQAVGDYDGDGKADFAARGADNIWRIHFSATDTLGGDGWGLATDIAVQGDYDHDGKTDIAVWRPSNGVWYIRKSSNGAEDDRQWGMNGDIPVPAPYRRP